MATPIPSTSNARSLISVEPVQPQLSRLRKIIGIVTLVSAVAFGTLAIGGTVALCQAFPPVWIIGGICAGGAVASLVAAKLSKPDSVARNAFLALATAFCSPAIAALLPSIGLAYLSLALLSRKNS